MFNCWNKVLKVAALYLQYSVSPCADFDSLGLAVSLAIVSYMVLVHSSIVLISSSSLPLSLDMSSSTLSRSSISGTLMVIFP